MNCSCRKERSSFYTPTDFPRPPSPQGILSGMKNAVDVFVGDAEPFDDLTMLCLEYIG